MTAGLQDFLATRLSFPGLAAWGLRLPDCTGTEQSLAGWIKRDRVEQVLARVAVALEGLRQQRLEPARLCWKFEHLRLYAAQRGDGAWLALVVQNQALPAVANPEAVLDDFLALQWL
jgi:hypothetical protein